LQVWIRKAMSQPHASIFAIFFTEASFNSKTSSASRNVSKHVVARSRARPRSALRSDVLVRSPFFSGDLLHDLDFQIAPLTFQFQFSAEISQYSLS
jgi:hypothetical protein